VTRREIKKLKKLIDRYANAKVARSHMGGMDPESFAPVRKELADSRAALNNYITELSEIVLARD